MNSSLFKKIKNKKVLITGGSSGVGKALAELCVQNGAHVAIVARQEQSLNETKAHLDEMVLEQGQKVVAFRLDIRNLNEVSECSKDILKELGGLDILINNAGISEPGLAKDMDVDAIRNIIETNYFGSLNMTKSFLDHFSKQRSGHISFVSSVLGFMGVYGHSAYSASKFALSGLAESLRQELKPFNIKVSIAFIPNVDTPLLIREQASEPEITKMIAGKNHTYSPEEIAKIYLKEILGNKFHIVPGFDTKLLYYAQRFCPALVRYIADRPLKFVGRE